MSTIIKIFSIMVLYLSSAVFSLLFAQINESAEKVSNIYLTNKSFSKIQFSKDTTSASFAIYRKGYETQKSRDAFYVREKPKKHTLEYIKKHPPTKIRKEYIPISTNFITFKKPEIINDITTLNYITDETFRVSNKNFIIANPVYIIHKLDNGTYLKWTANVISVE